jgi:hypothetical protein
MECRVEYDTQDFNPMGHEEAMATNAVHWYLLGDLTSEQRSRFENHYFECRTCTTALAVGQELLASMKPRGEPWWRRLVFPVLVPALASCMAILAVESYATISRYRVQIAGLSGPQANTVITAHPQEKGEQNSEPVTTDSVSLEMTLPEGAASRFYRVEIREAGKRPITQVVPAPKGSRLSLHLTKHGLGSGTFIVTVYGLESSQSSDGQKIETYFFKVQ